MKLLQKPLRILTSISLVLLLSFSSILTFPHAALSQTLFTSGFKQKSQNKFQVSNIQVAQANSGISKSSFPDIKGHWTQQYIEPLAARAVVVGYPDGKFKPDDLVTRTEFAAIVNKAFMPVTKRSGIEFTDVSLSTDTVLEVKELKFYG